MIDLLMAYNDDDEIEIEVYETISGKYIDSTSDITFMEDKPFPTLKIDIEAEKVRKPLK